MRILITLLLFTPLFSIAQTNRSANELARETTRSYVEKKLFKGQAYIPGPYGEIKSYKDGNDLEIEWLIEHKFEIVIPASTFDKRRQAQRKQYNFTFFLDHQMKVKKAESYSREG